MAKLNDGELPDDQRNIEQRESEYSDENTEILKCMVNIQRLNDL